MIIAASLVSAPRPETALAARLRARPISANELSRHLNFPVNRITQIINCQRGGSGDSALRLGRFFETKASYWVNLQMAYELRLADEAHGDDIRRTVPTFTEIAKVKQLA